jgi:hypothetical protein
VLAERAVEWAARLVGADAAAIFDGDGSVIAARSLSDEEAKSLLARVPEMDRPTPVQVLGAETHTVFCVDLPLSTGDGKLMVMSGPFTPVFGTDEVGRLEGYATAVTAGLDRTVLTERIAALERTKTQFLNLA